MGTYLKNILKNSSTRILVIIFFSLVALTGFFLVYGYFSQLKLYEEAELNRLSGVAKSLAVQINGDTHARLYKEFQQKDGITKAGDSPQYDQIHKLLAKAEEDNALGTAIYTLVYDEENEYFNFVVTSRVTPYYRHSWLEFKPEHVKKYETGGLILPYEDENGTWLSAFEPILDSDGRVVAIVQADEKFGKFISEARYAIAKNSIISLVVFLLIAVLLLRSIRTILLKEEELNNEILHQKLLIEAKNKDIMDSIHYAKKIQDAILPSISKIQSVFPDSFVLFIPRDIVSGDFYWFAEKDNHAILAAVDCTGHGVPGAFMSMIGNTILNDIVIHQDINKPSEILDQLDSRINKVLEQEGSDSKNRDGMDLALCCFHKDKSKIEYSGAFRPLIHVRDNELIEVKADKFPIGGGDDYGSEVFSNQEINTQPGDVFYMFSDGYPDQFGGEKGKKFMNKRFKNQIIDNHTLPMQDQAKMFMDLFDAWKGEHEQVDDVCVIGVRV